VSLEVVPKTALADPPAASVNTKVNVLSTMRYSPFNTNRYLKVPPKFSISVYARIKNARFMAVDKQGNIRTYAKDN